MYKSSQAQGMLRMLRTLHTRPDVVYLDAWPEHYASYRNRSVQVALESIALECPQALHMWMQMLHMHST